MPDIFLTDRDLAARYGVARNTIWRWSREREDMPKPLRLSPGCTRWRLSEVEAWEATRTQMEAQG
jgi:predicted DNA-binding transcriptional regulator AlpA